MNLVVSVVDAYTPPATVTLQSYNKSEPSLLQTVSSASDRRSERPAVENGDMDHTVSGADIAAPPRKRIKHSHCSSPQDSVDIKIADSVTAVAHPVCVTTIFTPTAATATTPSLCLAQALPLSGRIIGTVWQPVQSQSVTTAVSASDGITLDFCLSSIVSWLLHFASVVGAKCILVTCICVSVCLCDCPFPHAHTTARTRM